MSQVVLVAIIESDADNLALTLPSEVWKQVFH